MYKIGDKFIIEIGDTFNNTERETLYRIKGFNSLVFDEYGLDKLDKASEVEEEQWRIGDEIMMRNDAWTAIILSIDPKYDGIKFIYPDGKIGSCSANAHDYWKKTGKHYTNIEAALRSVTYKEN